MRDLRTRSGTPFMARIVAFVWRAEWMRTRGSPAPSNARIHALRTASLLNGLFRFDRNTGVSSGTSTVVMYALSSMARSWGRGMRRRPLRVFGRVSHSRPSRWRAR